MSRRIGVPTFVALFVAIGIVMPCRWVLAESEEVLDVSWTSCPAEPAPTEIEGETVVCGTVTVPENYDDPSAGQVELAFAILRSASLSPAADPVIYLHGGPGAAELRELAKMTERFAPIRQQRDVVIFDQRGTGYSNNRLLCEAEYATNQDEIRDAVEEYRSQGGVVDEEFAVNRTMFKLCVDRFRKIGTDLTQYNTVVNAHDVVKLADTLGYETYNLYGFSYGTQLALEVMRQNPTGLRSVILDSVAPADIKLYENFGLPNVEAILSLLAMCESDTACRTAYPNLKERFVDLLNRLDEEPIQAPNGREVTASTVVGALRQGDIRPGLGAYIPRMIWELEQGNIDTLNEIYNQELPPQPQADTDPVLLRYAGRNLSGETKQLISAALRLRQEAHDILEVSDALLEQGDHLAKMDQYGSTAAARFHVAFQDALDTEPLDRRLAIHQEYLALPIDGLSVSGLQRFIDQNFMGVNAATLSGLADELSDADVEELADIIFGKSRDYAYFFDVALALSLYMCQEHVPYNTIDGALDSFGALEIPQVARGKFQTVQDLFAYCELFPTGLEPVEFHEPVVSDLPVLILQGTADTQTALSWGEHAAESLPNSTVVRLPETGHGALRYSQCARDIGAAFLSDPVGNLNTSCVELLRPQFVLPQ